MTEAVTDVNDVDEDDAEDLVTVAVAESGQHGDRSCH